MTRLLIALALNLLTGILWYVFSRPEEKRERREIDEHLARLGATDIRIKREIFDNQTGHRTFNIDYVDITGQRHSTTTVVNEKSDATAQWNDDIESQIAYGQFGPKFNSDYAKVYAKLERFRDAFAISSDPVDKSLHKLFDTHIRLRQSALAKRMQILHLQEKPFLDATLVEANLDWIDFGNVYSLSSAQKRKLTDSLIKSNQLLRSEIAALSDVR